MKLVSVNSSFRYIQGIKTKKEAERCYLSEDNLVQLSVFTPIDRYGNYGDGEKLYYVAKDRKSPAFETEIDCRNYIKGE